MFISKIVCDTILTYTITKQEVIKLSIQLFLR